MLKQSLLQAVSNSQRAWDLLVELFQVLANRLVLFRVQILKLVHLGSILLFHLFEAIHDLLAFSLKLLDLIAGNGLLELLDLGRLLVVRQTIQCVQLRFEQVVLRLHLVSL